MKPGPLDLEIYRGDSFERFMRIRERVLDGSVYVDGDYVDLTDWVGVAQYRASVDAVEVAGTFSVVLADQVSLATRGGFFMRMTDEQTTALTVLTGVYDLQFTLPDETVRTFLKGAVTVDKDVSRT